MSKRSRGTTCRVCRLALEANGWLMCKPHWALVPTPLKYDVLTARRSLATAKSAEASERCLARYRAAAGVAIESVQRQLSTAKETA